jgi:hypothetical protein
MTRAALDMDWTGNPARRADERDLVRRLDAEFGRAPDPYLARPGEMYTPADVRDTQPLPVVVDVTPEPAFPSLPEVSVRLTRGDIVAGARADASGVLVGWAGEGEMTRARIIQALAEAGVPEVWGPRSKSARSHVGVAIDRLASSGMVPRAERSRGSDARYTARWNVAVLDVARSGALPGDATGTLAITFTLVDETLTFESTPGARSVAEGTVAEFQRMLADEVYKAGEVTDWLRGLLRERCHAVKFGGVWYVPARQAGVAEAVCTAVSTAWGTDWLLPVMPVASTDEVRHGLAKGLHREAAEVARLWEDTRLAAAAAGKAVGARAAGTAFKRITEVAERVRGFSQVLEVPELESLRARLLETAERVRPYMNDSAQRGAVLEMD